VPLKFVSTSGRQSSVLLHRTFQRDSSQILEKDNFEKRGDKVVSLAFKKIHLHFEETEKKKSSYMFSKVNALREGMRRRSNLFKGRISHTDYISICPYQDH
jgi:uncharacterized protein YkuJ